MRHLQPACGTPKTALWTRAVALGGTGLVLWATACSANDLDDCRKGEFMDHCEGHVAVTCERSTTDSSGFGAIGQKDRIERRRCDVACGAVTRCSKECDICKPQEVSGIGCVHPDAPPAQCYR